MTLIHSRCFVARERRCTGTHSLVHVQGRFCGVRYVDGFGVRTNDGKSVFSYNQKIGGQLCIVSEVIGEL